MDLEVNDLAGANALDGVTKCRVVVSSSAVDRHDHVAGLQPGCGSSGPTGDVDDQQAVVDVEAARAATLASTTVVVTPRYAFVTVLPCCSC